MDRKRPAEEAGAGLRPSEETLRRLEEVNYDPAFIPAVQAGQLSALEAIHRGDRDAYAQRLAQRHGVQIELAYDVTDGKIGIHEALGRGRPRTTPSKPMVRGVSYGRQRLILALLLVSLGVVATQAWTRWGRFVDESRQIASMSSLELVDAVGKTQTPTGAATVAPAVQEQPSPAPAATEVRRDIRGRITQVIGPDARTVLASYADAAGADIRAVGLAPPTPRVPGHMLGLYRSDFDPDTTLAIRISQSSVSGKWTAGNGQHPIVPVEDYQSPHGAATIPVKLR